MRNKSKDLLNKNESKFRQKISAVNNYIKLQQCLPDTLFLNSQLIDHLKMQKPVYEINNILKLKQTQTILFATFKSTIFSFNNIPLQANRRYIVNVNPSVQVIIHLTLSGSIDNNIASKKKYKYLICKPQGIVINQSDWSKATIQMQTKTKSIMNTVKITLQTIQTQFKSKISANNSQKKVVKKMVEDYIEKNYSKNKIQQIISKRRSQSMSKLETRSKTCFPGTRLSLISSSTNKMISSAQGKRDLIKFQKTKQNYLNHIQKMSPQKSFILKKYQCQYDQKKLNTLKSLIKLICGINIMSNFNKACIKISRQKMIRVTINMMCKRFIQNMHKTNKMRISYRNRNRTSCNLNLSAISCLFYSQSKRQAEKKINETFHAIYFKETVQKVSSQCELFTEKIKKIQKQYRNYRLRLKNKFKVLVQIKKKDFQSQKQEQKCFNQYLKYCSNISGQKKRKIAYNFVRNHQAINQILEGMRQIDLKAQQLGLIDIKV